MAAQSRPTPPQSSKPESGFPQNKRETADERRLRRLAVARDTQTDLKRECAERRDRKNRT